MSEENKNSLIKINDAAGLSKPGTELIKKISTGLGDAFSPWLAKRRVEVRKIEVAGEIEINEMIERAKNRSVGQELRKQANMEQIAKIAVEELPPDASVENIQKMEDDKIAYFFKECDIVSDKDMQLLWGKILACEAANPRSISKRTIALMASMDKKDAEMFTHFGQFVWYVEDHQSIQALRPFVYEYTDTIYNKKIRIFEVIEHLKHVGLIFHEPLGYNLHSLNNLTMITLFYHNTPVFLKHDNIKDDEIFLRTGTVSLTQAGMELFPICGAQKNEEFFQYIIKKWKEYEYKPSFTQHS